MLEPETCPDYDNLPGAATVGLMLIWIFIEYVICPCFTKQEEVKYDWEECEVSEKKYGKYNYRNYI